MHAYLTHPQVTVDPSRPVPRWSLSAEGRGRAELFARGALARDFSVIVSSDETKAVETADIVAAATGAGVHVLPGLHENDRSATGFLPPHEFERMADAFFAEPLASIRGWERAADAQARIVAAVTCASSAFAGPILFVGHGAVGTLLMCHAGGLAISRRHDQRPGGGCLFRFDLEPPAVVHPWRPLEEFSAP